MQEIPQKSSIDEIVAGLDLNQIRFITAMIENGYASKAEGARHIGLQPNTVYKWPDTVDAALRTAVVDLTAFSLAVLRKNLPKALMVKVKALDSDNERIRQDAASELIDRVVGKPTQRQEITGADGEAMKHETKDTSDRNAEHDARHIASVLAILGEIRGSESGSDDDADLE